MLIYFCVNSLLNKNWRCLILDPDYFILIPSFLLFLSIINYLPLLSNWCYTNSYLDLKEPLEKLHQQRGCPKQCFNIIARVIFFMFFWFLLVKFCTTITIEKRCKLRWFLLNKSVFLVNHVCNLYSRACLKWTLNIMNQKILLTERQIYSHIKTSVNYNLIWPKCVGFIYNWRDPPPVIDTLYFTFYLLWNHCVNNGWYLKSPIEE